MPSSCCLTDAIEAALGEYPADKTLWLALSGGLDSVALLHRLATLPQYQTRIKQGRLKAIHIHHGLSDHADEWLSFCRQFCAALTIPFYAEKITLNNHHNNIEQQARDTRYQVFSQYVLDGEYLLTAHHADDQIETFFLRLLRGAGLDGLASIPLQRQHLHFTIVRPLLGCSRAQLLEYAQQQQLHWVEDESNQDTRFDRNWWRQELLPRLWQKFPGRKAAVLRSLAQLQQDQHTLKYLLNEKLEACQQPCCWPNSKNRYLDLTIFNAQPPELQAYIIRNWLQQEAIACPAAIRLQQFCVSLAMAKDDKHPQLVLGDWVLQRFQMGLYLRTARVATHKDTTLVIPSSDSNTDNTNTSTNNSDIKQLKWFGGVIALQESQDHSPGQQSIKPGSYRVLPASRCNGRTLQPQGRPHKTLKHIWQENQVPLWLRADWPCLLNSQGELVAVIGLVVAQSYYSDSGRALYWRTK